jgi:hypothetical protein
MNTQEHSANLLRWCFELGDRLEEDRAGTATDRERLEQLFAADVDEGPLLRSSDHSDDPQLDIGELQFAGTNGLAA